MTASRKFQYDSKLNNPTTECSQYLISDKGFGTFSVLLIDPRGKKPTDQISYRLCEMPDVLPELVARAKRESVGVYVSQSVFKHYNRQRSSFLATNCVFLDLDTYNIPSLAGVDKREICDMLYEHCQSLGIPLPSVTISSGGGMYAKWFLRYPVNQQRLPYWEAVMQRLSQSFYNFGADKQATDASRVLTLVGSVNAKRNALCEVVDVNYESLSHSEISRHTLNDFQPILPFSVSDCAAYRHEQKERENNKAQRERGEIILGALKRIESNGELDIVTPKILNDYIRKELNRSRFSVKDCEHYLGLFRAQANRWANNEKSDSKTVIKATSAFKLRNMAWNRYLDICRLTNYRRENDTLLNGQTNEAFWLAANFYLSSKLKDSPEDLYNALSDVARNVAPHWDDKRVDRAAKSVYKRALESRNAKQSGEKLKRNQGLYRLRDETIHERLGITEKELTLKTGDGYLLRQTIGEDERNRRDPFRKERQRQRKIASDANRRRENGAVSWNEYTSDKSSKSDAQKERALELKEQGMVNKDIAIELGITVRTVVEYTKDFDKKSKLTADVKRLKGKGMTNNEIATALDVSKSTVIRHGKL